jgi:hypothetical protein
MPVARPHHQESRGLLVTDHRQPLDRGSKSDPQLNVHAGGRGLYGALEEHLCISDRMPALELAQASIAVRERRRVIRHMGKDEAVIERVGKRRGQRDGDSEVIRVGNPTHN